MENLGHNNPPENAVLFKEKLATYQADAEAVTEITDENVSEVNDTNEYGKRLFKEIEKVRKDEKQPHLDAGKAVDATYNPIRDEVKTAQTSVQKKLSAFLAERERKAQVEAARKAEELRKAEEARLRAEAEKIKEEEDPFLAATAENTPVVDTVKIEAEAKQAEEAALAARRVESSHVGVRAAGLKTKRTAIVKDPAKVCTFYLSQNKPELLELLTRLVNADLRAKNELPEGVEIKEERSL